MFEKLLAVLYKWLYPPKADASHEEVYTWRVGMAGAVFIVSLVTISHVLVSFGLTPVSQGFASAESISILSDKITQSRVDDLSIRLLDLQLKRCGATGDLRNLLSQQITAMLIEYRDKKHQDFPLPTCQEMEEAKSGP